MALRDIWPSAVNGAFKGSKLGMIAGAVGGAVVGIMTNPEIAFGVSFLGPYATAAIGLVAGAGIGIAAGLAIGAVAGAIYGALQHDKSSPNKVPDAPKQKKAQDKAPTQGRAAAPPQDLPPQDAPEPPPIPPRPPQPAAPATAAPAAPPTVVVVNAAPPQQTPRTEDIPDAAQVMTSSNGEVMVNGPRTQQPTFQERVKQSRSPENPNAYRGL